MLRFIALFSVALPLTLAASEQPAHALSVIKRTVEESASPSAR